MDGEATTSFSDEDVSFDYQAARGIGKGTHKFYGVQTKSVRSGHDGEFHPFSFGFPYKNGSIKAKRIGDVPRKEKYKWIEGSEPNSAGCFGSGLFDPVKSKFVVITEGEHDALAVHEATGGGAALSVQSSSTALRDITVDYEEINRFSKIIICFDNDEVGQSAVKKVMASGLFDFNKLFVAKLTRKDANDYLLNQDSLGLYEAIKAAKKYTPDNIISSFSEIQSALQDSREDSIGTYPTQHLQHMLGGLFRGQVVVVKALEGVGKTELFRLMENHLLRTGDCRLGVIHMEEDKAITIHGFATYELGIRTHIEENGISEERVLAAYMDAVGHQEDRVYIYTMFGGDDVNDVLDSIRFLVVTGGVDVVFLDHITLLTTGLEEGDERRKLDYISTKLKKMAKELNFCLVMISHVNDEGQTRGSRNITKIADTVIHIHRDLMAEDEVEKNTLTMDIEKNRMTGRTGRGGSFFFNEDTGKLEDTYG